MQLSGSYFLEKYLCAAYVQVNRLPEASTGPVDKDSGAALPRIICRVPDRATLEASLEFSSISKFIPRAATNPDRADIVLQGV